jgi:hypothetical protein
MIMSFPAIRTATPFRHRRRRLRLDREPHRRDNLGVAAAGHAVLSPITRPPAPAACRSAEHRAVDAPSFIRWSSEADLLPVRPGCVSSIEMSMALALPAPSCFGRRVGFAREQHVGVVLRVGFRRATVIPDVAARLPAGSPIVAEPPFTPLRGR